MRACGPKLNSLFPGLKTVVSEIPPGSQLAATACVKLAPKVIAQVESVGPPRPSSSRSR